MKRSIRNVTVRPVVRNDFFNGLSCEIKTKDLLNMRGCCDRLCGKA